MRAILAASLMLAAPALAFEVTCDPDPAVAAQEGLDHLLAAHEAIYNPKAAITTAEALLEHGQNREAMRLIRRSDPIDPDGAAALILARQDKLEDARKRLKGSTEENLPTALAIAGANARLTGQAGALRDLGQRILEEEKVELFQGLFTEALAADQIGLASRVRDDMAARYDIAALTEQMDAALDAARLGEALLADIRSYAEAEPSDVRSALALRALVSERAARGDFQIARQIAEMIMRPDARALALMTLADAMPRERQAERIALLDAALADLEDDKSKTRPIRFTSITLIHARLGQTAEALAAADRAFETIRKSQFEDRLRADALAALAAAGSCDDAQQGMSELPEDLRLDAQRNAWLHLRLIAEKWR